MIKEIHEQGADVLYEHAAPVVPIITRGKIAKKETQLLTLTDQTASEKADYHYPGLDEGTKKTHKNTKVDKEQFTCVWPDVYLELVKDLLETAESIADRCMGLSSTQIWDKDEPCPAIFVMRWPCKPEVNKRNWEWQEFINPIIKCTGKTLKLQEGCLSYPKLSIKKTRKSNVLIGFQTLTEPRRRTFKFTANEHGWIPHVMQHECDHLRGACIRSRNFKY